MHVLRLEILWRLSIFKKEGSLCLDFAKPHITYFTVRYMVQHCFLGFTTLLDTCGVFVRVWHQQTDRISVCSHCLSCFLAGDVGSASVQAATQAHIYKLSVIIRYTWPISPPVTRAHTHIQDIVYLCMYILHSECVWQCVLYICVCTYNTSEHLCMHTRVSMHAFDKGA